MTILLSTLFKEVDWSKATMLTIFVNFALRGTKSSQQYMPKKRTVKILKMSDIKVCFDQCKQKMESNFAIHVWHIYEKRTLMYN